VRRFSNAVWKHPIADAKRESKAEKAFDVGRRGNLLRSLLPFCSAGCGDEPMSTGRRDIISWIAAASEELGLGQSAADLLERNVN
jgi:hypothetical protein